MKARLFTAIALGTMLAAGSASAMSLQNDRAHDGGPQSFDRAGVSGQTGQNLILPYAGTAPQTPVVGAKTGGYSLQNDRAHDGSFN